MVSGYIKVHRAMLEWEWYHDDRCVRLLLHLLLKANYTDRKWKDQELKPGQLITSTVSLAEQLGWSRSALNRTMDKLKSGHEIETQSDNKWTLITLRKWDQFQFDASEPDSNRTADRTATGQQTGQQPDTAKEGKKGRREEGKNNFKSDSRELPLDVKVEIILPWQTETFAAAWSLWKKYKAEKGARYKPIGEQSALKKLAKEYASEAAAIAAIENSMAQNYQGIFPPKTHTFTNGARTDEERNAASRAALDKILAERRTAGAGA